MPEIKQSRSAEETIARRMRNSGGEEADKTIKSGEGVRRVYHNIHLSSHQAQHGADNKGEPGVAGQMRGPANRRSVCGLAQQSQGRTRDCQQGAAAIQARAFGLAIAISKSAPGELGRLTVEVAHRTAELQRITNEIGLAKQRVFGG